MRVMAKPVQELNALSGLAVTAADMARVPVSFGECRLAANPQTKPTNLDFELRFYVPLDTKPVIAETFFPASLLASTKNQLGLSVRSHHCHLLLLLRPKADTHFAVPRRVKG